MGWEKEAYPHLSVSFRVSEGIRLFLNSLIELKLLYTDLHILKLFSLESLGKCLHP